MKPLIFFVLSLFLFVPTKAQERYQEELFGEINIETFTYATKNGENLDVDVYYPSDDYEPERALILYVHGGGFRMGERDNKRTVEFCNRLASYGYVAASMSYRLTRKGEPTEFGCDCPATDKLNTFNAAMEDIQDALFFLIENCHQFSIDPQKIILAGSSAGAEAVLNTAYQPPYCYGLDSGPVSIAGVIGMAGAIPDTIAIYDESAVPSLLFHGTDDNLVPYATAPHHYCDKDDAGYLILHGSKTIADKLKLLGVPYWLHTTCGGGHELAGTPMNRYFETIIDFSYQFVIQQGTEQLHTIVKQSETGAGYQTFKYCDE